MAPRVEHMQHMQIQMVGRTDVHDLRRDHEPRRAAAGRSRSRCAQPVRTLPLRPVAATLRPFVEKRSKSSSSSSSGGVVVVDER